MGSYSDGRILESSCKLDGSAITLKREYLSVRIRDFGVQTTLRFTFTRGADQLLDFIKYKTPDLATTEITIVKFLLTFSILPPKKSRGPMATCF
ncbi:hypothetical protein EIM92_18800 [Paenibacillus lentus]|uniref:Uncharacterized protein n=1 Tax=Paenibacillus lentus TaxID=1338368 RepID=A0A3Q8SF03_9BACL|nr:hypothetical protein EIM92_18800 [Paenibacillus lentus]